MKLFKIALFAAPVLLLASCGGGLKTESSYKTVKLDKATVEDSIGYNIGAMSAMQKAMMAEQDTTIKTQAGSKAFDEGFYAGLSLLRENDEAYNNGLLAGLQTAYQLNQINEQLGMKLSRDAAASGFKSYKNVKADRDSLQALSQKNNQMLMSYVEQKATAKLDSAAKVLKDYKKSGKYYVKVANPGEGENLKLGDKVQVKMNILTTDNKELMPGMNDQASVQIVGNTPYSPLLQAELQNMKVGSSYYFLGTPKALFGDNVPPMVDPVTPYIFHIEVAALHTEEPATPEQTN